VNETNLGILGFLRAPGEQLREVSREERQRNYAIEH